MFLKKKSEYAITSRDENLNPYWRTFKNACNKMFVFFKLK